MFLNGYSILEINLECSTLHFSYIILLPYVEPQYFCDFTWGANYHTLGFLEENSNGFDNLLSFPFSDIYIKFQWEIVETFELCVADILLWTNPCSNGSFESPSHCHKFFIVEKSLKS